MFTDSKLWVSSNCLKGRASSPGLLGETRLAICLRLVILGHDELLNRHVSDVLRNLSHCDRALDRWAHFEDRLARVIIFLYLYIVLVHDTVRRLVLAL